MNRAFIPEGKGLCSAAQCHQGQPEGCKEAGWRPALEDVGGEIWHLFCYAVQLPWTERRQFASVLCFPYLQKGDYHTYIQQQTLAFMNMKSIKQPVNFNPTFFRNNN